MSGPIKTFVWVLVTDPHDEPLTTARAFWTEEDAWAALKAHAEELIGCSLKEWAMKAFEVDIWEYNDPYTLNQMLDYSIETGLEWEMDKVEVEHGILPKADLS